MVLLHFLNDIFLIFLGKLMFILIIRIFNEIFFRQSDEINSQFQKDILEILDFSSLKWKLSGVNISPTLQQILGFL